ncbi:MAG: response regulator [Nitrososphaeraceae archaeon]|jgi:CheY-like chemotaxis protein/predicted transcriptional regulator
MQNRVTVITNIYKVLSNPVVYTLLNTLVRRDENERYNSQAIRTKLNLTRKQYYKTLSKLLDTGLVKRTKNSKTNGKYSLTSLGKVFYYLQIIGENAANNHLKLKAIDSLYDEYPKEDRERFIDVIIGKNQIIKDILSTEDDYHVTNKTMAIQEDSSSIDRNHQQGQKPLKILIVEDEIDILFTYKSFLINEGYFVDGYTNPYEALKAFLENNVGNSLYYDLVVLDIRMPEFNGLQIYQTFKAIDDNVKVLFVSALDAAEELVKIFPDMTPDNIIRKPINQLQFLNAVRNLITTSA